MNLVTLDFETFYGKDYTLSSKAWNTSGYIRAEQFKAHGVGIKINDGETRWVHGEAAIKKALAAIDWKNSALLAHNTAFDGAILAWRYEHIAAFYYDTMSMTRGLHNEVSRASLDTVAKLYGVGEKSKTYLTPTYGLRELSPKIMQGLGEGCIIDCDLTYAIFQKQKEVFPEAELKLIDLTLRMFIQPVLVVNKEVAEKALAEELKERTWMICAAGVPEKVLTSNPKFADALRELGVEPPMKISLTTGAPTYAFAQTDEEFTELLDHDDIRVVRLAAGRLAAKSTLFETRGRRLIDGGTKGRRLPIMLLFYGAKTGRWSGGDKLNPQNLPRLERDEKGTIIERGTGMLRLAIEAPAGHRIVVADSAQIEARTIVWLAGQNDIVEMFAKGEDVYCHMASVIYNRIITKKDKLERFIGKISCLSSDTLVLTLSGWKRILEVKPTDMVWDGIEWIQHQGSVARGIKKTQLSKSVRATADHEILTEHGWREWREVRTSPSLFQSALSLVNLPLSIGNPTSEQLAVVQAGNQLCVAHVDGKGRYLEKTFSTGVQRAATVAEELRQVLNAGGSIKERYLTISTGNDFSIACRRASDAATQKLTRCMRTTANAVFTYIKHGVKTAQSFYCTRKLVLDGIDQNLRWTESTTNKGMNPVISDSSHEATTQKTNVRCPIKNSSFPNFERSEMTYDLLSAGPRNRFTVWSDAGPIIVHNCLGLGYGMGPNKFQTTLAAGIMGPPVDVSLGECKRIVKMFRAANSKVMKLWAMCEQILNDLVSGRTGEYSVDGHVILSWEDVTVWLPNGMGLHYPELKFSNGFTYEANKKRKKIYGGLLAENIVQALARIFVADQMLKVEEEFAKQRLKLKKNETTQIVLMTHDEIVSVVPDRLADKTLKSTLGIMRERPVWAQGVPLDAEGGHDTRYSK